MSTYEISKSSLLSLKAEILRKQGELSKVKADNEIKIRNLRKNTPLDIKNKGVEDRHKNDLSCEEEDLLRKSRSVLEAKTKLYDQLSKRSTNESEEQSELKKRYLVRFDKKNSDLPPDGPDDEDRYPESEEEHFNDDYDDPKNPEDEWVEYVDCLGRTRTCLRKDLEYIKANDAELKETQEKNKDNPEPVEVIENTKDTKNEDNKSDKDNEILEENELLSSDMRRELLRKQWENEEEALRNKTNIHYQDILFSEARTHGVGYYEFSRDEEERAAQQKALSNLRKETEAKQKRSQELKALREKQLAARIKAAKNRKRARLGLPPEEETEETAEPEKKLDEEEPVKPVPKGEAEKEKLLEEARKKHIRPWDIGKEGLKEHYIYSQEEWVDKKRNERQNEFAPPSAYRKNFRSNVDEASSAKTEEVKSLKFSSRKETKSINPYKRRNNYEEIEQNELVQPTPIVNECEYEDRLMEDYKKSQTNYEKEDDSSSDSEDARRGKGAEFAPPPTFDYYGPSSSKRPRKTNNANNIEDSIEAGLKFLRKQVEKKDSGKRDKDMFIS